MKFTCDSCGAQYLISDDKIGPRGVKVRCKKCSHVIILRPPAAAVPASGDEVAASAPLTGGSASSVPVAPSVAAERGEGEASTSSALPDDVVGATSSDLGLSQEFRALGFEEGDAPAPRAATLSVGLDLNGAPSEVGLSPFSSERAGGSLDVVPPEEPSAESTAVQARPSQAIDQEETEMAGQSDPTASEATDQGLGEPEDTDAGEGFSPSAADALGAAVGLGAAPTGDIDDDDVATRVESLDDLARSEAATGHDGEDAHVEEDETQAADSPFGAEAFSAEPFSAEDWQGEATSAEVEPAPRGPASASDSAELGAALEAAQRDEVEDMRHSIDGELAGLSGELEGFGEDAPRTEVGGAPSPAVGAQPDPASPSAADALAALAASEDAPEDDDRAPAPANGHAEESLGDGLVVAGQGEAPFSDEPGLDMPPSEDDSIAEEIGSAFEAMFGEGGPDGGEDELAALQSALGADETNKAETRVFDTDAMAQVEAEQERAAATTDHEGPEPKEWYVAIEEEQVGPLSQSEVRAHFEAGRLQADSLCWKAGMADWMPVQDTPGLSSMVPPPPEPRVPTALDADNAPSTTPLSGEGAPLVAAVADDESADVPAEPPKIEPQPEPAPRADSEPAWRPSAASALASLAAEELAAPDPAPPAPAPAPAAGPAASLGAAPPSTEAGALAASDALEKLLEGEPDKSAASQFGAAEQSESYVRPLPRRADTVSSLPLRDPTQEKRRPGWVLPASIIGGFVVLGLFVLGGITLLKGNEPAPGTPPDAVAAAGSSQAGRLPPNGADDGAKAEVEAQKAEEAAKAEAERVAAEAEAKKAEEEAAKKAEAEAEAKKAEAEAKKAEAEDEPKKTKRRRRRPRRTTARRTSPQVEEPEPQPEVRAPPPPRGDSVEADLLGVAKPPRRRAAPEPEPRLPEQLDDADVLEVLRSKRGDVRRCLEKQAEADPTLAGTMTVELVIRRSGRPKGVRVREDRFKRAVVGTCMVAAVKRWRFPKFSGAAMPLDFPVRVRGR